MKLYLLTRKDYKIDYDSYDSVVVCAENEDEAKKIHPSGNPSYGSYQDFSWEKDLSKIIVTYIGEAEESLKPGVILASYNAG